MTIHKQTSLNFDDKKYIVLAQTHSISITVLYDNHPCQDIRKSSLYSLSVPTLTVSTKSLALNVLSIALYTFKNFNNIYILQNYLSGHALKIKVYTQIIFEQETDSNII